MAVEILNHNLLGAPSRFNALGRMSRGRNCRLCTNNWFRGSQFQFAVRKLLASCCHSTIEAKQKSENKSLIQFLRNKEIIPDSKPPDMKDLNRLYQFFDRSRKLMVLTGAGLSTESGIPDYRSPNGAYSSGFKPITHQEFVRSSHARRRYWARSYAGWRREGLLLHNIAAHPSEGHIALATLEKVGRVNFLVTQNVDRLHHRAGSEPLELHGTVYTVVCLNCGTSVDRNYFQDQVKALNAKWAAAVEGLEVGAPGSDKNFGMQQRPDGDIEIDEKYWEQDFIIPDCHQCGGMLKPDVVFFGDNVPKDRADKAMEAAKSSDAFLVLGSSLMTMSAFRLVRAAYEAKADVAIVNIGETRADDFVPLKINARVGEILPRLLQMGCLSIPCIS
ncbi:NAD-dependent protein deacylase SRT2 isoform X2 [Phalaenopsis equestris]|uniref:NAD-dependent protein deacylase SRT2 isoform X2 n=1 Tax=Phalaenopsis equestris TaxID=78828 RepID=UPI0009E646A8|nr:NAD-dependent protein deacylase SRT2 isoform X2 [Phalaenopsis equestris]